MALYYFNTAIGNDSYTSTQAQSQSTPWQSVAKFNSFFASSSPGDSFAFQRGQTFYGTMVISRSGASGNNINIIAYGSGAAPIISAFTPLNSWASLGSNLWSHSHDAGLLRLNMVTIGGVLKGIGRYPNSGWYEMSGSGGSGSSTTLTGDMPTTINWAASGGAGLTEVVIQKTQWIVEKHIISAQSGSTITFNNANPYMAPSQAGTESNGGYSMPNPANGWGYFIQNDIRACDTQGDWMHDPVNNIIRMYSTVNPSTLNVEAAGADTVLLLSGRSYLYFQDICFRGGNIYGYYQVVGNTITMINVEFAFIGFNAMDSTATSGLYMENIKVHDTGNGGQYLRTSNSQLINSEVYNIGQTIGMGTNNNQANVASLMVGGGNSWVRNYFHDCAYNGIYFNGDNLTIENNYINGFCNRFTDGGGIYASGNEGGNTANRIVRNNRVTNGIGERAGTPYGAPHDAHGIYMDDSTTNVTIFNNSVDKCSGAAYFLHNTQHIDLDENYGADSEFAQFLMQHDPGRLDILDCNISNNTFVSRGSQPMVFLFSSPDNIHTFGTFFNNIYSRLADPSVLFTKMINGVSTNYSLSSWKAAYGWDASSRHAPAGFVSTNPDDIIMITNEAASSTNVPLDGIFTDIYNNSYDGNITIPAHSGFILFKIGEASEGVETREIPGYDVVYV